MTTSAAEQITQRLKKLFPSPPLDTAAERGRTASEVLFLETIQVAVQERWFDYARFLLGARAFDLNKALASANQTHQAVNSPSEVLAAIALATASVRLLQKDSRSLIGGAARRRKVIADHELNLIALQYVEFQREALSGLPKGVQHEVDSQLCASHRQRVVAGMSPGDGVLLNQRLHDHALLGLAMSGGGIRSASFAIGVLQALAKRAALPAFNYVSSVSGGGYAASWYMAWAYRHRYGTEGVSAELASSKGTESGPLWWVRRHSSYLAPRLSLASASDAVALLVAYVFNWLPVFSLICCALTSALLVPHVMAEIGSSLVNAPDGYKQMAFVASGLALVVLIGGLRRLTMYYRQPTWPTRYPSGMAATIVTWYSISALTLSTSAPLLSNARSSGVLHGFWFSFTPIRLDGFLATFVCWVIAYLLGTIAAWVLSLDAVSSGIDRLRFHRLKEGTPHRARLTRLPVPRLLVGLGILVGAVLGAMSTEYLMGFLAGKGIDRYVIVIGPLAMFQVLAASELSNAFFSNAYMREVDRAWTARVGAWMISGAVAWLVGSAVALTADDAFRTLFAFDRLTKFVIATAAVVLIWWLIRLRYFTIVYIIVATAYVATFSAFVVSPFVSWWAASLSKSVFLACLLMSLLTLFLASLIDVNRFSLHSLYREGLVRTFLGASRLGYRNPNVEPPSTIWDADREPPQFQVRRPDPVTSIDDDDNPALYWLRSRSDRALPVFLLNAAVNGQSNNDVDGRVPRQWPYTFSQYYCGSPADGIGYAASDRVFSRNRGKPITLGTAMAVSGAAVSPTAGRSTHPIKAFVFGLLNARLGLWVGNPQYPGAVPLEKPGLTGFAVLWEILGIRRRFKSWIHLSDGGHFENLGVYELLRRGCARIVVVDSSCDPSGNMSDLANAIRRARIDLGIVVRNPSERDFAAIPNSSEAPSGAASTPRAVDEPINTDSSVWRWFTIEYGDGLPLGRLLYIKPSLSGSAKIPIEVHQYSKVAPSFPHETTADQFFSEAQMEAYRSLGQACGEESFTAVLNMADADSRSVDQGLAFRLLQRFKTR